MDYGRQLLSSSSDEEEEEEYEPGRAEYATSTDESSADEDVEEEESEEGKQASSAGGRKKRGDKELRASRFLRHKHISVLPPTICKVLDMREEAFDMSLNNPSEKADVDHLLQNYLSRISRKSESGAMYTSKGGFYTQLLECILTANDNRAYLTSRNKARYVAKLRAKLSEIPNLPVLVAQEIWTITNDAEGEPLVLLKQCNTTHGGGPWSGADSDPGMFMHTLTETELRHMVRETTVEFDMNIFYRIAEEYFKVNIYCISTANDTLFEIPRHRFYHCRPSRRYRECVVLYKTTRNSGQTHYNLVISNSVLVSDKELRGWMPRAMSRRCHTMLVNSHNSTMVKNRSIYMDVMSDVDYLKHFTRELRAVAVDGAGKADFLVLGISDSSTGETRAFCCVKCLQVQPPNTALWVGPPARIPEELAMRIFGRPKSRSYDGLVYDGYGVDNGFVVFTRESSQSTISLPPKQKMADVYITARAIWILAKRAYSLYAASKKGGSLHGWVEFSDRYVCRARALPPCEDYEERDDPQEETPARCGERSQLVNMRQHDMLVKCMDRIPDRATVPELLAVAARVTPSLVSGEKMVLTEEEAKCVGMYAPSTRDPVGMSRSGRGEKTADTVLSFGSKEAALTWCIQRDLNEKSCCTMPLVETVDVSNSRGAPTYLYKEPVTQRMYIVCNGNMVKLECCLLTSLIWRENSLPRFQSSCLREPIGKTRW